MIYLPSGRRELNVKAVLAAFNQEKALLGAFSVVRDCTTSPINRFAALLPDHEDLGSGPHVAAQQRHLRGVERAAVV